MIQYSYIIVVVVVNHVVSIPTSVNYQLDQSLLQCLYHGDVNDSNNREG